MVLFLFFYFDLSLRAVSSFALPEGRLDTPFVGQGF
jgi:hypothetical protein